jgi:hypothetical protein
MFSLKGASPDLGASWRFQISHCVLHLTVHRPYRAYLSYVRERDFMGQVEQWQILAEEAAQERDPEKLMEIIEALTRALDDRDVQRSQAITRGAA